MLRAMRRTADAPQRPASERTASLRAMLSSKRSAICCEQCAGLHTLRSVRFQNGPHRFEPRLAVSARRYAASNAQDCKRSAASVFQNGPHRFEPCLALSARRYAASNAQDCRRSAASGFRAHRIASQIAYALQAPFRNGSDRFEPCLALSARRYAAKNATRGIVYSIIFADRFSSHWKGTKNGAPTT